MKVYCPKQNIVNQYVIYPMLLEKYNDLEAGNCDYVKLESSRGYVTS